MQKIFSIALICKVFSLRWKILFAWCDSWLYYKVCTILSLLWVGVGADNKKISKRLHIGGAASARGNCANMTRRARAGGCGYAESSALQRRRASKIFYIQTQREERCDAARALFYRSRARALSICMYMRARLPSRVCKYKEVLERFVRGGYDANSRQRAPSHFGVGQNQNHSSQKCIPTHKQKLWMFHLYYDIR